MPNGGQYIINEAEVDTLETNLLIYTKNSNLKVLLSKFIVSGTW